MGLGPSMTFTPYKSPMIGPFTNKTGPNIVLNGRSEFCMGCAPLQLLTDTKRPVIRPVYWEKKRKKRG